MDLSPYRSLGEAPFYVVPLVVVMVVTTGATGHALATVLLEQGAKRVDIWAAARTPLQKS